MLCPSPRSTARSQPPFVHFFPHHAKRLYHLRVRRSLLDASQSANLDELIAAQEAAEAEAADGGDDPFDADTMTGRILRKITDNLKVTISNVHIRCVARPGGG